MNLQTIKMYHINGNPRLEYTIDNQGHIHGTYRNWYYNGQLGEQSEWVNGEHHGTYKEWYYNGQLGEQSEWVNGKRYGIVYFWTEVGSIDCIQQYNMGDLLVDVDHVVNPILVKIYSGVDIESTKFVMGVINRLVSEGREYEIRNC